MSRFKIIFRYSNATIYTSCSLQVSITMSSLDSENVALFEVCAVITWLIHVLVELATQQHLPLYHQKVLDQSNRPLKRRRNNSKRIELDRACHSVKEPPKDCIMRLTRAGTEKEASFLTKTQGPSCFAEPIRKANFTSHKKTK